MGGAECYEINVGGSLGAAKEDGEADLSFPRATFDGVVGKR